jgi:hypothetical protein
MEDKKTYTITGGPLKSHEYVIVRRTITAEDEAEVQNHTTKIGGSKKNPKVELTIGNVRLALLEQMIEGWRLTETVTDPDGHEIEVAIPLSAQAIRGLDRRYARYIEKKINELNPDDEEDDEAFTSAANGHSGGSSTMMKMSHRSD